MIEVTPGELIPKCQTFTFSHKLCFKHFNRSSVVKISPCAIANLQGQVLFIRGKTLGGPKKAEEAQICLISFFLALRARKVNCDSISDVNDISKSGDGISGWNGMKGPLANTSNRHLYISHNICLMSGARVLERQCNCHASTIVWCYQLLSSQSFPAQSSNYQSLFPARITPSPTSSDWRNILGRGRAQLSISRADAPWLLHSTALLSL